jgi:hypothetical protein
MNDATLGAGRHIGAAVVLLCGTASAETAREDQQD